MRAREGGEEGREGEKAVREEGTMGGEGVWPDVKWGWMI